MLRVDGQAPYDVVIGPRRSAERLLALLASASAGRGDPLRTPSPSWSVRSSTRSRAAYEVIVHRRSRTASAPRRPQVAAVLLGGARRGRLHPLRRRGRRTAGAPRPTSAGFVAATWLRGVKVVHVPTTLLGDGRRGGRRQDRHQHCRSGKNLVGSFHEPAGVLCDLSTLRRRCPRNDFVAGLGGDHQVRLHRRPRDPRAGRGATTRRRPRRPTPRCSSSWSSVRSRSRPTSSRADLKETRRQDPGGRSSTTATPWRTRSSAPRTTRIRHGEAVADRRACTSPKARRAAPGPSTTTSSTRHHEVFARARAADDGSGARPTTLHRGHEGRQEVPRLAAPSCRAHRHREAHGAPPARR